MRRKCGLAGVAFWPKPLILLQTKFLLKCGFGRCESRLRRTLVGTPRQRPVHDVYRQSSFSARSAGACRPGLPWPIEHSQVLGVDLDRRPQGLAGIVHQAAPPNRLRPALRGCRAPARCRLLLARSSTRRLAARRRRRSLPSASVHRPRNTLKRFGSDDSESLPCVSSRNDRRAPKTLPV
jgi:hypothetical protein